MAIKKKVLVIDDQIFMQKLLAAVIAKIDADYYSAENGEIGLKKSLEIFPDIIILDVMLPNISDIDLLKKIKEQPEIKNIPVIMLSGKSDEEIINLAEKIGAYSYFTKPINPKKFEKVLSGILIELDLLQEIEEEKIIATLNIIRNEDYVLSVKAIKKIVLNYSNSRKILTELIHIIGERKIFELKGLVYSLLKKSGIQPVREKCIWALGQLLEANNKVKDEIDNKKIMELIYSIAVSDIEPIELRLVACVALKQIGLENAIKEIYEVLKKKYSEML